MVSFLPEPNPVVARRIAINLNQLIRGTPVSELPTMLPLEPKVLVNGRTAAAIGFAPTFESRIWIEILHEDALDRPETPLTFKQALAEAQAGNVELTIKDANVQTILQDKQIARSPLLPQLDAFGDYATNEQGFLAGILPDQIGTVGVGISQMLYDDRVVSDYRSAKRFYEGAEYDREATRLDVLFDAGIAYLAWVLARVSYRIEIANLELTQDNLELSKIRYEAGYSGQDEVFRWEAEVAGRRSELFRRNAEVEARRIAFNQVLGVEQDRRWKPEEIQVDPDVFFFLDGRLDPVFKNARELSRFRDFIVAFALENSPELLTISKAIEAEGIQLGQRKRAFILPTFSAMLNYNYVYHKRPDVPEDLNRSIYEIRFLATYPIFNGAARLYDKRRSETLVQGLSYEQRLISQLVERQTRTSLRAVENSFPTIKFSNMSADNSNKNFDIVQDKYAEGIVNVTDLLQAQTSAFVAKQSAAEAVYSFLIDLVGFERSISWFEAEKKAQEKDDLVGRIELEVMSP
jgi:outer membrane protein TolC